MANPFKDYIVKLKAGDLVFNEGDPGTEMYIIQSGRVEIFNENPQGSISLAVMEKGDFFGEMALLDGEPHMAAARALEEVELIEINSTLFDRMIKGNPEIAVRMMRKLSIRLREANKKNETLLASGPQVPAESSPATQVPVPQAAARAAAAPRQAPPEAARTKTGEEQTPPAPKTVPVPASAAAPEGAHAILHSEDGTQTYPLVSPKAAIGRFDPVTGLKPEVDLSTADINRSISRQHARLSLEGGIYYLCEEPGALNGTFINGRKLITGKPARIKDGDSVSFGMVKLVFRETRKA
jgi:CRP-like cAMP-binding protein